MKRVVINNPLATILVLITTIFNIEAQDFQWVKGGTSDMQYVQKITTDQLGNVYLVGYSYFDIGGTWGTALFIGKYDNQGKKLWIEYSGGSHDFDGANSIVADNEGNLYVSGYFNGSTISFGNITLSNPNGNYDFFIVKFDSDGNAIWAKKVNDGGLNGDDFINGITIDTASNFCVTGYFSSDSIVIGSTTLLNSSYDTTDYPKDFFIAKYDSAGNALWAKKIEGSLDEVGNGITCDKNNNFIVTGYFKSDSITIGSTTLFNTLEGNKELFVVKYNSEGDVIWAKKSNNEFDDYGTSICTDANKNIYVLGVFFGANIGFDNYTLNGIGNSSTSADAFISKYDSEGNYKWSICIGGEYGDELMKDITSSESGKLFVTGSSNSDNVLIGTANLTINGYSDILIASYDTTGKYLWSQNIGDMSNFDGQSEGRTICNYGNDNLYVSGCFQFTVHFDVKKPYYSSASSLGSNGYTTFLLKLCLDHSASISANSSTTFCEGDSVTLSANTGNGYTYQWIKDGVNISGATNDKYITSQSGNFSVNVINTNGCSDISSEITLTVLTLPNPSISASGPTTFCEDSELTIYTSSGNGSTFLWEGTGLIANGVTNSSCIIKQSGSYWVIATNVCGSDTSSALNITVNPNPPSPTISLNGEVLSFDTTMNCRWYLNDTLIWGAFYEIYVPIQSGIYTVEITDVNGCKATSYPFNFILSNIESSDPENNNQIELDLLSLSGHKVKVNLN